jgi:hypothetical protein
MTAGLENPDIIIGIGQILGIITSVVTIVIVYVIERKALIGWRKILWCALSLLWFGIILIILALIFLFTFEYSNILSIFGIFFWILGILIFMKIFYQMCFLETIPFSKPDDIYFDKLESRFKADCIDSVIEQAKKEDINLHFPVILAADEGWEPWNIGLNLANDALEKDAGVIFFTFTRPDSKILDQLDYNFKKFKGTTKITSEYSKLRKNLIIIDCFTPIAFKNKKDDLEKGVFFADPRNPHELNKKYNRALEHLHKNKNKKELVVIYDSLSEFLFFSDLELATQYLRHNMVWEEKNNVNSLYIVRLNTLEKSLEEYILWFADAVIYLKTENQMPLMRIRGLFKGPKNYDIEYNYKFKEKIQFQLIYFK